MPELAAELVRRQVTVIFAGSTPATLPAKAATATIPIAFIASGDPVQLGLVTSFNRPGGNATGVILPSASLEPKRLELLHEVVPGAAVIGVLMSRTYPLADQQHKDLQAAASARGLQIHAVNASEEKGIDAAFKTLAVGVTCEFHSIVAPSRACTAREQEPDRGEIVSTPAVRPEKLSDAIA